MYHSMQYAILLVKFSCSQMLWPQVSNTSMCLTMSKASTKVNGSRCQKILQAQRDRQLQKISDTFFLTLQEQR